MTDEMIKRVDRIKDESWGPVDGDKRWLIDQLETAQKRIAELEAEVERQLDARAHAQDREQQWIARAEAGKKEIGLWWGRAREVLADRDRLAQRVKELERLNDELRRIHGDVIEAATDPARAAPAEQKEVKP